MIYFEVILWYISMKSSTICTLIAFRVILAIDQWPSALYTNIHVQVLISQIPLRLIIICAVIITYLRAQLTAYQEVYQDYQPRR